MTLKTNKEASDQPQLKWFAAWVLLLPFFCLFLHGALGQVKKSDSLQIAKIITLSRKFSDQHNYSEAVSTAKKALEQSSKLNFNWGLINSQLELAQAHKALSNYPESLNNYLQALSEIKKQNNDATEAIVDQKIGELFQQWGVPEKALPYYEAALKHQPEKSVEQRFMLIERIAEVYLSNNQSDLSMKNYLELLDLYQKKNDLNQTKRVLEKIASICSLSNNKEASLKYRLQLLEIDKQLKDDRQTAATLNVIGNDYKELRNLDKALENYQAALSLNRKGNANGANDNAIVSNLINIGNAYQMRGDNRNSIKSFDEALLIIEKKGTPAEMAVMHNYLATLYLAQGNFSDAEDHTLQAIKLLAGTENKRTLAANYKRLSEIYSKQSNYEKSLESYQAYSMLKDSLLYREQLAQEKEKLKEHQIETAEKEAKLSLIDNEMKALELRNEKEKAEREKQKIELLLKEKELQNLSLQKEQSEQERAVQLLQLQKGEAEKEKQTREILVLQQKRDLQNAEIQKKELEEKERQKEIDFKNTKLELQQTQLDRAGIRQQSLSFILVLFVALIALALLGYVTKRRDNQKLQTQFHEINRQKEKIESINESLIELNEEKNDLISIVAHDLKSPLNQISGMLEIMKLTGKDQPAEQHAYTSKIEQSTNRLKRMVTKILNVNAIEAKTLDIHFEKIELAQLLDEIVNRFNEMAAKKNILVVKDFDGKIPPIQSDGGYLSEVLENLMSNAVKYSPLGKQITVRLTSRDTFVRMEFIDQGQGISQKDMKHLFGKYRKLTARPTAGEDSTGLGLSIVKKYVVALQGKVWCESEEGSGSNFIVELPVG